MKKVKHLAFALLATLLSVVTVNAKQMTAKELGEEAAKIAPKARFIFVIGKYAYTSTYDKFNIQDVMLASSDSIELDKKGNMKDLVSTMTIYRIDRTYNSKFEPTGWSIGTNEIGNGKDLGTTSSQKKIDIRYIDYNAISEDTTATISYNLDDSKYSDYKKVLEDNLKFKQEEAYGDKLELVNGKLTGLLLKNDKITLSTEDQAKYKGAEYYFAYILEVPNATSKTTVTATGLYGSSTVGYDKFDVTGSGKTPGMVVLVPLSYENWQKNKKITVTVDLDGEEKAYLPTTKTIDLSGLTFQTDSTYEVKLNSAHDSDKKIMSDWGYNDKLNRGLELKDGKLTGTLVEQVLNSADVYGAGKETGYYYDFTFDLPSGLDVSKIRISSLQSEKGEVSKTFIQKEYDEAGDLTLFPRIDPSTDCQANAGSCKLYFSIDLDGPDGKQYLPVYYTIDYSQVVLEKSSIFTVDKLTDNDIFTTEDGWYDTDKGYSVDVTVDEKDHKLYHVTGVLPIVDDTDWEDEEFDSSKELYYLGLLLKLTNAPSTFSDTDGSITVKFAHDDSEDSEFIYASDKDFGTSKTLYLLKALSETTGTKEFTITVDLDGASKEEYAPYTVTIDWSGLKLQKQTTASVSVAGTSVGVPQTDQELLKEYGYQFPDDITLSEDNNEHNKGALTYDANTHKLSGTIKEQKLIKGFSQESLDSYFYTYIIKPEVVTDDIIVTITAGEDDVTTYNIDDFAVYDGQKVLTILQHIPLSDKDSPKDLKIKIDSDGDSKKGYLISEEYTIEYDTDNLDFVDLHTVTYNNNENQKESSVDIYDGEKLDKPEDPKPPVHEEHTKQYIAFDHWNEKGDYEDTEFKFTEETSKSEDSITDDVTLYPIWEIDVEQYMSDVIKHVNETDSAQDKFQIEESTDSGAHNLTVDILERTTKISNITDTDIAEAIAHALSSGEIDSIEISFNSDKTFNASSKDSAEKIEQDIKEFLKTELSSSGEETLDDLYQKWQSEQEKEDAGKDFTITIMPNDDVAILKDKTTKQGITYNVSFEEELIISYDAGALTNPDTSYVKTNGNVDLPEPQMSEKEKEYRTFDGWYEDGEQVESLTKVTKDHNLTAHYTLNVDKFVEEVVADLNSDVETYSDSFENQFDLAFDKETNVITINLKSANVPLTTLADTSIPGTIAYILQRGEITGITLSVDDETVDFSTSYKNTNREYTDTSKRELLDETGKALKENIVKGAKEAFDKELNDKEESATLDQLEFSDKTFTLKIGGTNDNGTVKFVDSKNEVVSSNDAKTYTFKFDSDFAVVNEANYDLGASTIQAALDKEYSTIYLDSDISLNSPLTIEGEKNVSIESIENSTGISLASTDRKTISVTDQDSVIDAKSGTIILDNIKLVGGKNAELIVEGTANVTINNLDISGIAKPEIQKDQKEFPAGIIVKGGSLKVESNIVNENESYDTPAIRIPKETDKTEITATVTFTGKALTKNDRYYGIVKHRHESDEVSYVYDVTYYTESSNSKVYCITFYDHFSREASGAPYSMVKWYRYGEHIEQEEIKEFRQQWEEANKELLDEYEFVGWYPQQLTLGQVPDSGKVEDFDKEPLVDHKTYYAAYKKIPVADVGLDGPSTLSISNNKVSGVIKTQTDRKYYIPVTLTSSKFKDGVTTVDVIDPNGHTDTVVYNDASKIARISSVNDKKINLQLEAIKENAITGDNGKEYTINLYIDGKENGNQAETYVIDYSKTMTEEEIINRAAQNTQNLNSLTTVKDNHLKSGLEKFTYEFDREKGFTHYKSTDDTLEQYSFRIKYLYPEHTTNTSIVVSKKTDTPSDKPELNGWLYDSTMTQVGTVTHELNLLQDRRLSNQNILNAINEVKRVENDEHTYQVILNKEAFEKWINATYVSLDNNVQEEVVPNDEDAVTLTVVLDDSEQYVKSIKTEKDFTISSNELHYSNLSFNVQYSNFDSTDIVKPEEMLKDENGEATIEELKELYEAGKIYWEKHTGAEIFEG